VGKEKSGQLFQGFGGGGGGVPKCSRKKKRKFTKKRGDPLQCPQGVEPWIQNKGVGKRSTPFAKRGAN